MLFFATKYIELNFKKKKNEFSNFYLKESKYMLYFKVQFNKKLTSESNPEERAKKELWGWKPKASAPAGTFKGRVKSLKISKGRL